VRLLHFHDHAQAEALQFLINPTRRQWGRHPRIIDCLVSVRAGKYIPHYASYRNLFLLPSYLFLCGLVSDWNQENIQTIV